MQIFKKFFDRFIDAFNSFYDLDSYKEKYIDRLLSQKKIDGSNTSLYSNAYYNLRVRKYNYTNKNHNYYLTGKFQNTLKIFYEKGVLILQTDADYYKYLLEKYKDAVSPFGVERYELIKAIKQKLRNG